MAAVPREVLVVVLFDIFLPRRPSKGDARAVGWDFAGGASSRELKYVAAEGAAAARDNGQ
jgi:hypothetical protein